MFARRVGKKEEHPRSLWGLLSDLYTRIEETRGSLENLRRELNENQERQTKCLAQWHLSFSSSLAGLVKQALTGT